MKKKFLGKIFLILLLITAVSAVTVRAEDTGKADTSDKDTAAVDNRQVCWVRYFNNGGTKEYTQFRQDVRSGDYFTARSGKDSETYMFLGWSRKKNSRTADIKANKKYNLMGNLRLYAVWKVKPKGVVRFYSQAGAKEYTAYRITKYVGQTYTLPRLKDSSVYRFLGWSESRCSLSANLYPGKKYTMTGNKKLYAVYIKKTDAYATFVLTGGQVFKICRVDGRTVKFPSITFRDNRTCQGWSTSPGKTRNPQYKEYDIVPRKTATYYTVDGDNMGGMDDGSRVAESKKYQQVYFVGDSRIFLGEYYLADEFEKTTLIQKGGSGCDWLVSTGYKTLLQKLREEDDEGENENEKEEGRTAVVFCSGINDMTNVNSYISFYKSKASQLMDLGCDLYVMSLNPFNRSQSYYFERTYNGKPSYTELRTQDQLNYFNTRLKTALAGTYKYIDTNSYLTKNGWATYNIYFGVPDGLHYSKPVTRKMFSYAAACLDK